MSMNVGELNYSLGIEDNTKADMAKARAALRKLEEDGAVVPLSVDGTRFDQSVDGAMGRITKLDATTGTASIDADDSRFGSAADQAFSRIADVDATTGTFQVDADVSQVDAGAAEGESSLVDMIGGWSTAGVAAGAMLGVAIAGGLLDQFFGALERDQDRDRLAAALGLTPAASERAGAIAGGLYANAYGDSLGQVNEAVEAVSSTLADANSWATTDAELTALTAKALDYANVFGEDVTESVAQAGSMVQQGLARDANHAFDLMVTGMQKVPAAMRGDLMDAVTEYGDDLALLGITGEEAMQLLANSARKGPIYLDKAGDSLKELQIRATDMSEASKTALGQAGLSAEDMAGKMLAGGDTARGAMQDIAAGLLSIEDPVEQSNAAIALFGAPLEDMSVAEIPAFLASLTNLDGGFDDTAGAADRMGTTLNDNLATDLEGIKRKLSPSSLLDAFQTGGWDAVEEQLQGGVDGLKEVWAEYGPEVIKGLGVAKDEFMEWWDTDGQVMLDELGQWWEDTAQPWLGDRIADALGEAGQFALDYLKGKLTDPQWWLDSAVGPMGTVFGSTIRSKSEEWGDATVEWLKQVPGKVTGMAAGMWDGIYNSFASIINQIIEGWNDLEFGIPKVHIPGTDIDVGGGTVGTPDIGWRMPTRSSVMGGVGGELAGAFAGLPSFDGGGIVPAPAGQGMLAMVHGQETIRTPEQEAALVHQRPLEMTNNYHGITDPQTAATLTARELTFQLAAMVP